MSPVSIPQPSAYDSLIVVSFGGPDGPEDVLPFLENVLRGRNVPRERMLEVVEHYRHFGGRSPINEQNRQLVAALQRELADHGLRLPVYWGNRNWHPLLPDTLRQMAADGVRRALAFVTSAFSSYSGCRQYREDILRAQQVVAAGGSPAGTRQASRLSPPQIDKLRVFFNHPGFIEPMVEHTRAALEKIPAGRRAAATLIFTAHSIPLSMAQNCRYEEQLREACRLVAAGAKCDVWHLVYQSRSGPPSQPWLEPDVNEFLLTSDLRPPPSSIILVPIGFVSDHMEVVYDLDIEARETCDRLGIHTVRAATVGTHPRFVQMIRELVIERMADAPDRPALGTLGPSHDVCADDCCLCSPAGPTQK